jgi:hypothetical protein
LVGDLDTGDARSGDFFMRWLTGAKVVLRFAGTRVAAVVVGA